MSSQPTSRAYLIAGVSIALFVALVAMRVRYWGQVPVGEENLFSQLALWGYQGVPYQPQLPTGMVDGIPWTIDAEHPSTPYWWFWGVGLVLRLAPDLSVGELIYALRAVMTVIFAAAIAVAFHLCVPTRSVRTRLVVALACVVVFSTPFWVGASIQLQQDGVVATVPYVLVFSAAIARARAPQSWPLLAMSFAGGFLVAFDKPERAAVFIGAAAASYVFLRVRRSRVPLHHILPEAGGFLAGLALILIIDGHHWLESFDVAHRIAAATPPSMRDYVLFVARFFPLGLGALVVATLVLARPVSAIDDPHGFRSIQVAVFAGLTVAAALRMRWVGDGFPRYYAPALALLQLWMAMQWTAIMEAPAIGARRIGRLLLVPLAALVMWQTWRRFPVPGRRSITSFYRSKTAPAPPDQSRPDCVVRVGIEAMNTQTGSWALDAVYGATPEKHAAGLGGKPFCN